MKNWIKILTLAGFVFLGTMIHSAVSANYTQGLSNGWVNPWCDNATVRTYFGSTPGCSVGTYLGGNGSPIDLTFSGTGITALGSFSGITSFTLTLNNNYSETQYIGVEIQAYTSGWQAICYQDSADKAVPVGSSDVTFTFTCSSVNNSNLAGGFLRFELSGNHPPTPSWDRTTISVAGYNGSGVDPGIIIGYPYNSYNPPVYKFAINGGFPPPITNSFTEPTNTNVAYYTPITFGGTCVSNGANQLSLTFGRSDGSVDNLEGLTEQHPTTTLYSGLYDIDCINNTWTKTVGGVSPSVVVAILVEDPGTTSFIDHTNLGLYVTADGRAPNFLSFDDVMTHSPEINDFNQWLLDFSADPSGTATSTKICAYYGLQASSTYFSFDCSYNFDPHTATYPNTVQFPKETPLPMGNYKAVGSWIDNNNPGVDIATTTEWDFSVVYSTSTKPATTFPNGGIPASTANSNSENNTFGNPNCNQGNIIVSGICSVAVYLLMPKSSDLAHFNGLFNNIKNKPPFGYFTAAQLAISGLATSTPAVMLAGISLLGVFFSPIRIGFTILIYFLAGLFIFNRLRHFNFQS